MLMNEMVSRHGLAGINQSLSMLMMAMMTIYPLATIGSMPRGYHSIGINGRRTIQVSSGRRMCTLVACGLHGL